MYDVIVIGGGASGLAAGITAKRRGKSVLICEENARIGRKILASGNGKCNLSNADMSRKYYNNDFVEKFLKKGEKVYDFFQSLGLRIKNVEGRYYPYSESANTVLNLLRDKFEETEILTNFKVQKIEKNGNIFIVNRNYIAKNIVLCTGSNATTGSNSHFLAEEFGHKTTELRASLVPLYANMKYLKRLANIRCKVKINLIKENKTVAAQYGEILFKDNGLSGIAIFMLSSFMARNEGKYSVIIDFAPDINIDELELFLRKNSLEGLLHKAVAESVKMQAADKGQPLSMTVKNFVVENLSLGDIKNAQVICGGLNTDEFDDNLQSKLVKNLYACGEALNVDGDCGGYNLFWAFLSGIIAGENLK